MPTIAESIRNIAHSPNGRADIDEPDLDATAGRLRAIAIGRASIPPRLLELIDSISEDMPSDEVAGWHERIVNAINVNADLTPVWGRWVVWMLRHPGCNALSAEQLIVLLKAA